jgi:hypothetical protein
LAGAAMVSTTQDSDVHQPGRAQPTATSRIGLIVAASLAAGLIAAVRPTTIPTHVAGTDSHETHAVARTIPPPRRLRPRSGLPPAPTPPNRRHPWPSPRCTHRSENQGGSRLARATASVPYSSLRCPGGSVVGPPSLHDPECQVRDTRALDHPGALQLDWFRGLVEQPDAIPEEDRHQV